MRFGRFWRQARLRNLVLLLAGAVLVPAILWAVPEIITRDTTQVPCSAIDDASAECRNLRYNTATTGLDVNIKGLGGAVASTTMPISGAVNQGTAQASLAVPWPVVLTPATGGTGPWQNSNLPAVNTSATFQVAGVGGQNIYVSGVCAGFYRSGGAMTDGGVVLTFQDGTNTFRIPMQVNAIDNASAPGTQCVSFPNPIRMALGATVTFTLPNGGANAQGAISAYGFQM